MNRVFSKISGGLVLALSIAFSGGAQAESIFDTCSVDLETYCSDVAPGNGRLYSCLYSREDKLNDSCDEALSDIADQMDLFFDVVRYATQECGADIVDHCQDVDAGDGRIYTCLKAMTGELTESCEAVMTQFELPEEVLE